MASLGKRIWRWIATMFASVVILLAVALGVFRLTLPLVPEYHGQLQAWASDAIGLPVRIGKIDARWRLKGPELFFSDARVLAPDESRVLIRAETGSVGINLFGLIRERQLQAGWVELTGAQIDLYRSKDGRYRIQGFESRESEITTAGGSALDVIPKGTFELRDARIRYEDQTRGLGPWTFDEVTLLVRYHGDSLELEGQIGLPPALGADIELSARAQGDLTDPESIDWQLLVEGEELDFAGWRQLLPVNLPAVTVTGDTSIWLAMEGGRLTQASVTTELRNLSGRISVSDDRPDVDVALSYFAATLQLDRIESGWRLSGRDLQMAGDGDVWPASQFEVEYLKSAESSVTTISGNASYLRFDELNQFLALIPVPDGFPDPASITLAGELRGLSASFSTPGEHQPLQYDGEVDVAGLGFSTPAELPQAQGVTAHLKFDDSGGRLQLDTTDLSFSLPKAFRNEVQLRRVAGAIEWAISDEKVSVTTPGISIKSPDLDISAAAEFTYSRQGGPPTLKVAATIADVDLSHLSLYLVSRIPPKVLAWLDSGIVDGRIRSGRFVFNGPLKRRPFDSGEARMLARFAISDATVDYFPGWPVLKEVDADVTIENSKFTAQVHSANLMGTKVEYAVAKISDMYESPMTVSATASGTLDRIVEFVKVSPLMDQLGRGFGDLEAQGRGFVETEMSIRLRKHHENDFSVGVQIVEGVIGFTGVRHKFVNVAGRLNASPLGLDGQEIAATLLGRPVTIDLFPVLDDNNQRTATIMTVAGKTEIHSALDALNLPIGARVDGAMDWNARVRFPRRDSASGERFRIDVTSDLRGVTVDLPAPLAKDITEARPLAMNLVFIEYEGIDFGLTYGDEVTGRMALDLNDEGWRFRRGTVAVNAPAPDLPITDGLALVGRVAELDLDRWLELGSDSPSGRHLSEFLTSIDLSVDAFDFYRQRLADARFQLNHNDREWLVQIDSEPIAGSLFVPFDLTGNAPIVANFERLLLKLPEEDEARGEPLDPAELPAMEVTAADFALGDRGFGVLQASLVRVPQGIKLQHFETESPSFTTRGDGEWTLTAGQHQSALTLGLDSTDVQATSRYLGYAGSVTGDKGTAMFDISWPGPPGSDFLKNASGTASISLENGQMTDVEPGAGRIFGLLSVTALPRRLSLDFRDVFDKGFGYDTISGDFQINDGNAYTENLVLIGPAANVGIVGRIGLAAEDYDQVAVVYAKVGNALPVGVALVVSPVVGAAMFLITEILKEPLGELMQLHYHVTGSWEDPVVERVIASQAAAENVADPASFR